MAAAGMAEILARIDLLTVEGGADRSEVWRLWGLVEGILKVEGRRVAEQMEVKQGLKKAAQEFRQAGLDSKAGNKAVVAGIVDLEVVPEFPKYLELPGPLVRERILSYLDVHDLLSVARAIPSETVYFKQPLALLELEAVIPILMNRKLLSSPDLQNLSRAHPHLAQLILRRLEAVEWKDGLFLIEEGYSLSTLGLKKLASDQHGDSIVRPVWLQLTGDTDDDEKDEDYTLEPTLEKLNVCGHRILFCYMHCSGNSALEDVAACLRLMPNLKVLQFGEEPWSEIWDDEMVELLPDLPFLKRIIIASSSLQCTLLQSYGDQLELVYLQDMYSTNKFSVPPKNLITVNLETWEDMDFNIDLPRTLLSFSQCRLKQLHICLNREIFWDLIILLERHWAGTLELLELEHYGADPMLTSARALGTPLSENTEWLANLKFPKVKCLVNHKCHVSWTWAFLLFFPALEQLSYFENKGQTGNIEEEAEVTYEFIPKLYNDRGRMLESNVWKLFPKLAEVQFKADGKQRLTRREWLNYQENLGIQTNPN